MKKKVSLKIRKRKFDLVIENDDWAASSKLSFFSYKNNEDSDFANKLD